MQQRIDHVWQHLKRTFGCRLCRRIAVGVFLAILAVEAGILFFSIKNYELDRLAEVEREAIVVTRAILRSIDIESSSEASFVETAVLLRDGSVLLGVQVFNSSGDQIAKFGELPDLFEDMPENPMKTSRRRLNGGSRMDVVWPQRRVRAPYLISARIDTSEIEAQIVAFVWRIAGLVLLISAFVTVVTMLIMDWMVLSPIIILSERLRETGSDPNNPHRYIVESRRKDELGDVIRAFNRMLRWAGSNLEKIRNKEDELLIAKEAAEHANRSKSVFLSSMSHDLRTPLNAILGFGQMLELSPKEALSENQKNYVGSIMKGGNHLLDLINEILDLAKIEAGKLELFPEDIPPGVVLDECLSLIKTSADDRGIEISIGQGFEAAAEIRADPVRYKQSLLNLMSNAVKYNRDNGKIKIDCHQAPSSMLRIAVTDTGEGIPADAMGDLFKPFNRLQAENSEIEGTGIGLTITKRFIEKMNGRIGVETEVGKGSTFWFELPLVQS